MAERKRKRPNPNASKLGTLVDELYTIREQRKEVEKEAADMKKDERDLEERIMEKLDQEKTTTSRGTSASVSINERVVPSVTDWDDFERYIMRTKNLHLLQRRPAEAACRELFEKKGKIPGVEPFRKRTLSVNKVTQKQ